jgi:hypothetical protein
MMDRWCHLGRLKYRRQPCHATYRWAGAAPTAKDRETRVRVYAYPWLRVSVGITCPRVHMSACTRVRGYARSCVTCFRVCTCPRLRVSVCRRVSGHVPTAMRIRDSTCQCVRGCACSRLHVATPTGVCSPTRRWCAGPPTGLCESRGGVRGLPDGVTVYTHVCGSVCPCGSSVCPCATRVRVYTFPC